MNAYVIKDRVAWSGQRNGIRYSLFSATIIALDDKQRDEVANVDGVCPRGGQDKQLGHGSELASVAGAQLGKHLVGQNTWSAVQPRLDRVTYPNPRRLCATAFNSLRISNLSGGRSCQKVLGRHQKDGRRAPARCHAPASP